MTDHKFTDEEVIKALECCGQHKICKGCPLDKIDSGDICARTLILCSLDLINRQKAEIERLEKETQKARRKALLEAKSKFAGHSDYHGDTILCKLICMAEGKEVGVATPLDKSEIKAEAIKEFAERLKEKLIKGGIYPVFVKNSINDLVKEMTEGETNEDISD